MCHIESKLVLVYKTSGIYGDCASVPSISRMHVISVCEAVVELWQNAAYYYSSEPDIIIHTDGVQSSGGSSQKVSGGHGPWA